MKVYSEKRLISLYHQLHQKIGKQPTRKQWNDDASTPSDRPIRCRFGTWNNFVKKCGGNPYKPYLSELAIKNKVLAKRIAAMHTETEAREWVDKIRDELIQSLSDNNAVPSFMKSPGNRFEEVWCAGCWLNEKLREAGATEHEIFSIGFAHGQRSFFGNPYKWAVVYLNEFEQQGYVNDQPGSELADEINTIHMQKHEDVVALAVEDPR